MLKAVGFLALFLLPLTSLENPFCILSTMLIETKSWEIHKKHGGMVAFITFLGLSCT